MSSDHSDESVSLGFCHLLHFSDEFHEMIKDNKDIMDLLYTAGLSTMGKTSESQGHPAFRTAFVKEVATLCTTEPLTLAKQQLYGFLVEVAREDAKHFNKEDRERAEAMAARLDSFLTESDPWVNFENKKYRYSRFMMLKRKQCYVVKMPQTGEYLAMDAEKLQNGFDKMKIPLKVKDLAYGNKPEERTPPKPGARKPTELEGLAFKMACELIIANGEKKEEEEEKVVDLDPVAQAKLDKKKEAKRANKNPTAEEMDEKEDFKLEVVNEEEAASTI